MGSLSLVKACDVHHPYRRECFAVGICAGQCPVAQNINNTRTTCEFPIFAVRVAAHRMALKLAGPLLTSFFRKLEGITNCVHCSRTFSITFLIILRYDLRLYFSE